MGLVLKSGAVFLHVPKTGGNWVSEVLFKCGLVESELADKHYDFVRALHSLTQTITPAWHGVLRGRKAYTIRPKRDTFFFAFVRNPLHWYESWFKYMNQKSRQWRDWGKEGDLEDWHPNSALNGLGSDNFETFVRNVITKRPGYVSELLFSYTPPEVRFVGKQESIRTDLVAALKQAGESFDEELIMTYKPVGVSKPELSEPIKWSPELLKKVVELEWAALVRYGYAETHSSPEEYSQLFLNKAD